MHLGKAEGWMPTSPKIEEKELVSFSLSFSPFLFDMGQEKEAKITSNKVEKWMAPALQGLLLQKWWQTQKRNRMLDGKIRMCTKHTNIAEEEVGTQRVKEKIGESWRGGKPELKVKDFGQVGNGRKKKSLYKGTEHDMS